MKLPVALTLAELATRPDLDLGAVPSRGRAARAVRLWPGRSGRGAVALSTGTSIPPHEHVGYEHILVLSGTQEDDRGRYPAGTMVINPPETSHHVRSPEGCVVLAIWQRPVRFLE